MTRLPLSLLACLALASCASPPPEPGMAVGYLAATGRPGAIAYLVRADGSYDNPTVCGHAVSVGYRGGTYLSYPTAVAWGTPTGAGGVICVQNGRVWELSPSTQQASAGIATPQPPITEPTP